VLALSVAACGDDDDDDVDASGSGTTGATEPASGSDDLYGGSGSGGGSSDDGVTASDFTFSSFTAAPGAEVTFQNEDDVRHTMTADDGSFDSGEVDGGSSATITAPSEAGDHAFHCEIHPSMTGTLTVE
jgi:plastocyanin